MPSAKLNQSAHRSRRWWLLYSLSVGLLLGAFSLYLADRLYPLPMSLDRYEYSYRVVDHEQQPLRFFPTSDGYWRFPVDPAEVSPSFIDMLIRFEDKRFYQHHGVDITAMLRAVGQRIGSGRIVSGGSTLTMQLARLLEPKPRTMRNKIRQMFRAWQLEWHLDKAEILQAYLTLAPYGGNLQGVEAASYFYFGLSASDLSPSQAALLVSLPQNPERLRPDRHPEAARSRRDDNLQRLYEQGVLSAETYRLALTSPVPERRLRTPLEAMHLSSWRGDSDNGAGDSITQLTLNRALQRQTDQLARNIQVHLPKASTVAIVVADRRTMKARAYVGSGGFFSTQFPGQVDIVQSVRSPGSTLKPVIYGMAFSDGWLHPNTKIQDKATNYAGYQPGNFDHRFDGEITIRDALIHSRNLPAIKVLGRLKPDFFMQRLLEQGIPLVLPADQLNKSISTKATLPIAVGGVGIRMADLVSLYGCLANQGFCQTLTFREHPNAGVKNAAQGRRLMSQRAAWMVNMILRELPKPIQTGTQRSDDIVDHPLAFKTGTSYGYRDAWAFGYDQDWVIGVWIGRPDGGFQQKTMGLSDAVPVLLSAFDIANQQQFTELARGNHNAVDQAVSQIPISPFTNLSHDKAILLRQPPPALQYFDEPILRAHNVAPKILYPIENTKIALSSNKSPIYKQQISVEIQAEHYPLSAMLNGQLIQQINTRDHLRITPQSSGAYDLVIIDAEGQSAAVNFWVDKAEE